MEMNSGSTLDRVYRLLRLCVPALPVDLGYSENLLQGGWIDSLAVVELGAKIEAEFGCKIASDFYTIRSLQSAKSITAYVDSKIIGGGQHEPTSTSV
jgi:hypothetical protein